MEQKALIIKTGPDGDHGLDTLNIELGRGWRVAHVASMGGAGAGGGESTPELCLAALVVLERREERTGLAVMEAEEEVEELIEEIVDGNGTGPPAAEDLGDETR